jgi:hypothetical protein
MRKRYEEAPISLFSFQDIITCVTGIMIFLVLIMTLELLRQAAAEPSPDPAARDPELERLAREHEALLKQAREQHETMLAQTRRLNVLDPLALAATPARLREARQRELALAAEMARLATQQSNTQAAAAQDGQQTAADSLRLAELMAQKDALENRLKDETVRNRLAFIPESGNGKRPILVQWSASEIKVKPLQSQETVRSFTSAAAGLSELKSWMRGRQSNLEYVVVLLKPSGVASFSGEYQGLRDLGLDLGLEPLEEAKSGVY